MKRTYPVVLKSDEPGFLVYIPDFDINTQGNDLTDAIEMARDAIGLMGIVLEDEGKELPESSAFVKVSSGKGDVVTLVDVDFTEYRRQNDMRSVKKNCTLPNWLCYMAEQANINFSQVLQAGLKRELHIAE